MANVSLSYADMQAAQQTFAKNAQELEASLNNLLRLSDQLVSSGFVTEQASPAFMQSYQQLQKGGMQVKEGINGLGSFLGAAVQGAQQLDQSLAKQLQKG